MPEFPPGSRAIDARGFIKLRWDRLQTGKNTGYDKRCPQPHANEDDCAFGREGMRTPIEHSDTDGCESALEQSVIWLENPLGYQAGDNGRQEVRKNGDRAYNRLAKKALVKHHRYADAQNNLGMLYLNGKGVSRDLNEAFRLFELSASQGDPWGLNNLGGMYEAGWGTKKDREKALDLYKQAAAKGNAAAQANLKRLQVTAAAPAAPAPAPAANP